MKIQQLSGFYLIFIFTGPTKNIGEKHTHQNIKKYISLCNMNKLCTGFIYKGSKDSVYSLTY